MCPLWCVVTCSCVVQDGRCDHTSSRLIGEAVARLCPLSDGQVRSGYLLNNQPVLTDGSPSKAADLMQLQLTVHVTFPVASLFR